MAKQIEASLHSLSPQALEALASEVHQAYLDTCDRLGWEVKLENKVPYEQLEEKSKELDRATVRAVAGFLLREVKGYMNQARKSENSWRESIKLVEHYKRAVMEDNLRFRNIREELSKRGVAQCAACKGEGGTLLDPPKSTDGQ